MKAMNNRKVDLIRFRGDNLLTQKQVAEKLQIKQGSYSEIERGIKPMSETIFETLVSVYGDTIKEYIINDNSPTSINTNLIPIIPISAMNNSLPELSQLDCEMILSPVKNSTLALRMKNDSMESIIPRGCLLIAGTPITQIENITWGQPYFLDTKNGQLVTYLYPSEQSGKVKCIFANERYPSFEVDKNSINNYYTLLMYLVEL